jgi:DDE superfamily endonuclease
MLLFQETLLLYQHYENLAVNGCSVGLTPEAKLLMTIWTLANQETFRQIADRYGLTRGYAHYIFKQSCQVLSALAQESQIIKWPLTSDIERLAKMNLFPCAFGAVDGCHIAIKTPLKHADINRKSFASVVLQATCTPDLQFIDISTGWPGSMHDARIYCLQYLVPDQRSVDILSKLRQPNTLPGILCRTERFLKSFLPYALSNYQWMMFESSQLAVKINKLNGQWSIYRKSRLCHVLNNVIDDRYHILGDSAYPLEKCLMVPYRYNGHLTQTQKNFNYQLSTSRCTIERAFALLKGKFRRLKYLDMNDLDAVPQVIISACVLHNVILQSDRDSDQSLDELEAEVNHVVMSSELQSSTNTVAVKKRHDIDQAKYQEQEKNLRHWW